MVLYDYIVVLCPDAPPTYMEGSKFPLILWCRCTHVVTTILIYARGLWFHARSRIVGARRDIFHSVDGEKFSCHKWHQDGVSIPTSLYTFQGTSDIMSGWGFVNVQCIFQCVRHRYIYTCICIIRTCTVSCTCIYTYMQNMHMYVHWLLQVTHCT